MKLNKVLALALSGVMAVSMLAGCSGKTDDNKDEQAPATGIVAAVNDGQDASNKVKVTFTADATLDSQLSTAVTAAGDKAPDASVQKKLVAVMGVEAVDLSDIDNVDKGANKFMLYGSNLKDDNVTSKKVVGVQVVRVGGKYTEAYAQQEVVKAVNTITAELLKNSSDENTNIGDVYAAYDYAGTVSMVETTALDGTTAYYAAIVITNTCTLKTLEA